MSDIEKLRLRTADLDEAIDAVTRIYCPHSVRVHSGNHGLASELEVSHVGLLRIVDLKYSARVDIEAGDFEQLMLMMSCTSGWASARQGPSEASWVRGQTLPLSPDRASQLEFQSDFAQLSVR